MTRDRTRQEGLEEKRGNLCQAVDTRKNKKKSNVLQKVQNRHRKFKKEKDVVLKHSLDISAMPPLVSQEDTTTSFFANHTSFLKLAFRQHSVTNAKKLNPAIT